MTSCLMTSLVFFISLITPATANRQADTVSAIDTKRSVIRWKGTKMMYTGSHEGTIRFRSGELRLNNGEIAGAALVADMTTIEITDIPEYEPVPRNNLKKHLEEDFDVARYPTASFSLGDAVVGKPERCGSLTIKGITRELCFTPARVNSKTWRTKLLIRRNDFAIGEQGSWLEERLVDQEIELEVEIVVH